MTTFIYRGYQYDNPVFSVKALTRKAIPEAFEQMHRLRHSGYLAGYLRFDAFSPAPGQALPADSRREPAPYVNFVLYRRRHPVPAPKPAPRTFCPALGAKIDGKALARVRAALLEGNPGADQVVARELELATAADGRAIFNEFSALSPYPAYYKDAFEEAIFLPRRELLHVDRPAVGAKETIVVRFERDAEASVVSDRARGLTREASLILARHLLRAELVEGTTVGEMLAAFVPAVSVLGTTARPADAYALECRPRGIYGGVVGLFHGNGCELALVERSLERRPGDTHFRLGVGVHLAAGVDLAGECRRLRDEVHGLILPEGAGFCVDVRIGKGRAFLLRESLRRLALAASARDVDTRALDPLLAAIADAPEASLPGDGGPLAGALPGNSWQELPQALEALVPGIRPATADGVFRLTLRLHTDGHLEGSLAPLTEPATRAIAFSRRSLDERNDFLALPVDFQPWYEEARGRAAAGECLDTLFVNRLGVVAGCADGAPVFDLDGELVTPPASAGAGGDVLLAALRQSGAVKEKAMSLAETFRARRVFHVSALRGILAAELANPGV